MNSEETIAAIATPPGIGGVGIIRVSGPLTRSITLSITGKEPRPRQASFSRFRGAAGNLIDEGIAILFPAPGSFTGEDVLELQGHGGPVVLDLLLKAVLDGGARMAHPGEFSHRAFINGKLDLTQAEAIADLIESGSEQAARLAVRSLDGEFSSQINLLLERLTALRMYIEAAIDFPEEEIDFLCDGKVSTDLHAVIDKLEGVQQSARHGRLLRDGMTLVIAGRPNAGKSSLMNALVGQDTAIVTDIPGTTRDLLREQIQIDGMPLHLIDTAGLRESGDAVEQEGIRRARMEIEKADRILWIFDDQNDPEHLEFDAKSLPEQIPITLIRNKIDITGRSMSIEQQGRYTEVAISAKSGEGMDLLREHLKTSMGYSENLEGSFIARRRHLDALERTAQHLDQGQRIFLETGSGELLAEDLRHAQLTLAEITGAFTSDDLLGKIFASFCIGK